MILLVYKIKIYLFTLRSTTYSGIYYLAYHSLRTTATILSITHFINLALITKNMV